MYPLIVSLRAKKREKKTNELPAEGGRPSDTIKMQMSTLVSPERI